MHTSHNICGSEALYVSDDATRRTARRAAFSPAHGSIRAFVNSPRLGGHLLAFGLGGVVALALAVWVA